MSNTAERLRQRLLDRERQGIETYGATLDRTDITAIELLRHARDEMLDAAMYLERLIVQVETKNPQPAEPNPGKLFAGKIQPIKGE